MLTLVGNFAPLVVGYALSSSSYDLPAILLACVPALYVASAVAFVVAGEKTQSPPPAAAPDAP